MLTLMQGKVLDGSGQTPACIAKVLGGSWSYHRSQLPSGARIQRQLQNTVTSSSVILATDTAPLSLCKHKRYEGRHDAERQTIRDFREHNPYTETLHATADPHLTDSYSDYGHHQLGPGIFDLLLVHENEKEFSTSVCVLQVSFSVTGSTINGTRV